MISFLSRTIDFSLSFWAYGFICGWPRPVSSRSAKQPGWRSPPIVTIIIIEVLINMRRRSWDGGKRWLFSFVSELINSLLTGEDRLQADQPNSLAGGSPHVNLDLNHEMELNLISWDARRSHETHAEAKCRIASIWDWSAHRHKMKVHLDTTEVHVETTWDLSIRWDGFECSNEISTKCTPKQDKTGCTPYRKD